MKEETLSAFDLQLHDYIYADETPVIVTSLSSLGGDVVGAMVPIAAYETYYANNVVAQSRGAKSIKNLKPIPLTNELFEKLGWEKDETYTVPEYDFLDAQYISPDHRIIANHETNSKDWGFHFDNQDFETNGYFEGNYYHELQHAMRMCGMDEEANKLGAL